VTISTPLSSSGRFVLAILSVALSAICAWPLAPNNTRFEVVSDMRSRKARMADLADGFMTLPGNLGTLEKLLEAF